MLEDIVRSLDLEYGRKIWSKDKDALSNLIATVLSQNTSDTNSHTAFRRLKFFFSSWEEIVGAPEEDIALAIKSGGLAEIKARRIKRILHDIKESRGSLDLGFLARLPVPEAKEWLLSLPGVGPKTAACVLLFSFGMPVMPVDTHVYRVARRLGLIAPRISTEKAHNLFEAMVDPKDMYSFHINMIEHGRQVCKSQRPLCRRCLLEEICPGSILRIAGTGPPSGLALDRAEP